MQPALLNEVKQRKELLIRELKAIDNFLSFYDKPTNAEILPSFTLDQRGARKLISVRLSNLLRENIGRDKIKDMSLEDMLKSLGGFPLTPEFESNFLLWPNTGRKALNELREIFSQISTDSEGNKT